MEKINIIGFWHSCTVFSAYISRQTKEKTVLYLPHPFLLLVLSTCHGAAAMHTHVFDKTGKLFCRWRFSKTNKLHCCDFLLRCNMSKLLWSFLKSLVGSVHLYFIHYIYVCYYICILRLSYIPSVFHKHSSLILILQ